MKAFYITVWTVLAVCGMNCQKSYQTSPLSPFDPTPVSPNNSSTPGLTATLVSTPSAIATSTSTVSVTVSTGTPSPSSTAYVPPVFSPTPTASFTSTVALPSVTFTSTPPTLTPSSTAIAIPFTQTFTCTVTPTATFTFVLTDTPTSLSTSTPIDTGTKTTTPTHTPTDTSTFTATPTVTATPTAIPPGTVVIGTTANFSEILANTTVPVVLEFWASWCATCTIYSPVVTQFASDYAGQVIVVRVNADENEALLNEYAVPTTPGGHTYGLPQTAFFLDGKEIIDATGYQSEAELADILSEL